MFFDTIPKALYIHIPFCKKKCSYCDFFSIPDSEDSFISAVLEETINQIKYFKKLLNISALKTIYIGGGTPSVIGAEKLGKFIETVLSMYSNTGSEAYPEALSKEASLFPKAIRDSEHSLVIARGEASKQSRTRMLYDKPPNLPGEFSIEINPETVTPSLLEMLNKLPVTRISIGVQSFNKKMVDTLGRNCTVESVYNALRLIKKYSNKKISIDLISSIPGQTVSEALSDVTTAVSFKPAHISLYYLTLEEGTKLYQMFTDKDQDERCWIEACKLLESSGYDHYEISNFCLPGQECVHNMNYWKIEPYIGCGLSAVSTFYNEGSFYRASVTDNPEIFLQGEKSLWGMETEVISKNDFLIELLMMGLRTKEGVNLQEIDNFFNIDIEKVLEPVISKWDKNGFITMESHNLALNNKGRYFHTSFMLDIMNLQSIL